MDERMNYDKAMAFLVAGIINMHLLTHEGPCESGDGCCPVCCAPCGALAWLRDNKAKRLALAFALWDTNWDWCNPDGTIKWDMIEAHWIMTECHDWMDSE